MIFRSDSKLCCVMFKFSFYMDKLSVYVMFEVDRYFVCEFFFFRENKCC